MPLLGATGGGSAKGFGALANLGYFIRNSLRFRSSATAYLNRTPATAGNRQTYTWSGWVKRGQLSAFQGVFTGSDNSTGGLDQGTTVRFTNTDTLQFYTYTNGAFVFNLITTQVFRDPSAWYHVVYAVDTTQATAANRIKLYINGNQVTAFGTATYPTQNSDTFINNNAAHYIGAFAQDAVTESYFDGYMAEQNFIDGQALTPSSFGKTDPATGQWIPKKFAGTYGTNGFYLKFADASAATAAAIGKDSSPNGNNWTPNNISVTAGDTYDAMIDSPTLSAAASNYCVWNPLAGTKNTISNGNLRYSGSTGGDYQRVGTLPVSSGKWYYETKLTTFTGGTADMYIGFSETNDILYDSKSVGNQTSNSKQYSIYNYASSTYISKVNNGSGTTTDTTVAVVSDIFIFALDLDNGKVWFGKNGTWIDSGNPATGANASYSSVTGTYVPAVTLSGAGVAVTIDANFGQRPFSYTPPTGFKSLNAFNLP